VSGDKRTAFSVQRGGWRGCRHARAPRPSRGRSVC
jgi:hypothetical protein